MAKRKDTPILVNTEKLWHNDLFNKIVSVVTVFGFGVVTGIFINSNEHSIELMKVKLEYNEKLHEEINKYRDCRIDEQEKKIVEINNAVRIITELNGSAKKK